MPRPFSYASVEIDVGEESAPLDTPDPETPFRILVLGDFSGRQQRGVCEPKLGSRRPVLLDRDNFGQVMGKLGIELRLPVGGQGGPRLPMQFAELEDFNPDQLFERLRPFQELREARRKLTDHSTFAAAAAELAAWRKPEALAQALSGGSLFDQVLEATEGVKPARDDWQSLLREIVAPYLEPKPDPKQPELIAQVDAAISGHMRAILHHPDFQAIESAWRAVFFLIRGLDTDSGLKLFLLDISKAELSAGLSSVYQLVVEQSVGTPGAQPWAVLAGNYTFEDTPADRELLGWLAKVAREAGAPFLSAAKPDAEAWLQSDPAWESLRRLPEARYLGLALPRFLLRLPYGKETSPIEQFDFEEMPGPHRHEDYLWGNPVFACVYLLAQAFSEYGWDFRPGAYQDIDGLPAHVYKEDGVPQLKPCAESLMTVKTAEAILDNGLMPLLSMKDSDRVRLARFQSLAKPAAPLAGRWK